MTSSPPSFEWRPTLKISLSIWIAILGGGVLVAFANHIQGALSQRLESQIDQTLLHTGQDIQTLVVVQQDRLLFELSSERALNFRTTLFSNQNIGIRLVDTAGNTWDSLGDVEKLPNLPPKSGYQTLFQQQQRWRIYATPVMVDGVQGWVQVGQSLQDVDLVSRNLVAVTLWPWLIVVGLMGGGIWILVGRAFAPLETLIDVASTIQPADFNRHLPTGGVIDFDEVERLTVAINRMLDRLQQAFERERRFVADASHELRTPLTVIKGKIQVSLQRVRSPDAYEKTIKEIEQELDRLIRLVNNLLLLARLEQGSDIAESTLSLVDLGELLEVLLEGLVWMAEAKQIHLSWDVAKDLSLWGDQDYLMRVFINLLDNGIKYANEGGQVELKGYRDRQKIVVLVRNTGPGIPAESLPHLFDRFYRVDKARDRHQGGTGLGLAIVQEIVRYHKGEIRVTSDPGEWTTFSLTFPLTMPDPALPPSTAP